MNSPGKPEIEERRCTQLFYSEKFEMFYFTVTITKHIDDIQVDCGMRWEYSQLFNTTDEAYDCKKRGGLALTKKHHCPG